MFLIQQITSDPLQTQSITLPDGNTLSITLYYRPLQYGWFFSNLNYSINGTQTFVLNELRITNNPNMLYQFKNQIPFGLACFTVGNREPTQQEDFFSGASTLYILSQEEVITLSEILQNG